MIDDKLYVQNLGAIKEVVQLFAFISKDNMMQKFLQIILPYPLAGGGGVKHNSGFFLWFMLRCLGVVKGLGSKA